jgi:hypothetical protein
MRAKGGGPHLAGELRLDLPLVFAQLFLSGARAAVLNLGQRIISSMLVFWM